MIVNTLTAVHVFNYLLAAEGWEPPYRSPAEIWPVFGSFLRLPSDSTRDVGSVFIGPLEEGEQNSVQMLMTQELTDDAGGEIQSRSASLTFLWEFDGPVTFPPVGFDSDQYQTLDEFLAAAEEVISATSVWRATASWANVVEESDLSDTGD